jgi:plastocyanin
MRFLLTLIALVGLVACSAPDASGSPTPEMPPADALAVSVLDFMIDPDELEVAGPTVTIAVTNDGPTPHNLTVRDGAGEVIMRTADLGVGESETISAELEPGDYTIFCALAGHESLGMSGTLRVSAP